MSAHVLLNLLNELGKSDKIRGLPSILFLFRNKFNKFNNTGAQMLDSIKIVVISSIEIFRDGSFATCMKKIFRLKTVNKTATHRAS